MTPQERIELEKMSLAHWMVGYANGMELQSERDRHAPLIKKLRRAAPCLSYRQNLARRRLEDAAPDLLEFVRGVLRYASNAGDDYLANKAREIINEVTGESTP